MYLAYLTCQPNHKTPPFSTGTWLRVILYIYHLVGVVIEEDNSEVIESFGIRFQIVSWNKLELCNIEIRTDDRVYKKTKRNLCESEQQSEANGEVEDDVECRSSWKHMNLIEHSVNFLLILGVKLESASWHKRERQQTPLEKWYMLIQNLWPLICDTSWKCVSMLFR